MGMVFLFFVILDVFLILVTPVMPRLLLLSLAMTLITGVLSDIEKDKARTEYWKKQNEKIRRKEEDE